MTTQNTTDNGPGEYFNLLEEFRRIVAGDCIERDIQRHQQVVTAIENALRSRAPLAAVGGDATLDGLRALLNRYAQPCDENCDHSQCPLLRELHALHMKRTLERAQHTVKPIVDCERKGEFIGDLMNTRLSAERVIEIVAATRQSSLWNRNGYDAALSATLEELRAAALRSGEGEGK